ncbi:aldo/keto reductase [Priestia sp. Y58]|uniref:aldo/keto reductase n=1 Tax=Priestia TaxID=2800373 RepID=UPI001C8ECB28|nr:MULTISPECIES: aldo/keto reductase [Priestia]MBX9987277.1 aldo/keto reductase [Priestia aryabhattai]MBX9998850.1 aldo/keto reductase [Priestia aryabhattai]MDG0032090.1 aldo/keto reductase [Priestia sp. Y58]MDG0060092.1 aldo/keto reductase [Priestia sp. P5]UYV54741.1 aldo/keto reductase [Priestia megaterium]
MGTNETILYNGVRMPWIGLGVWTEAREDATEAIKFAIKNGYRSIDTASAYANEEQVGRAVKESEIKREDIFIATKVANTDQGYESTLKAFEKSLELLKMDYIDLYLIHWPIEGKSLETWKALETLYKEKKVRAIGVSNFQINHLEELMNQADVKPMVNQVEYHPNLTRPELREYCIKHGIQMEAWSPLMRGQLNEHEVLKEIALKYKKSVAQVILRWNIQGNVVTIPKSFNEKRIIENWLIFDFELTDKEMEVIFALNQDKHLPPPDLSKFRNNIKN